MLDVQQLRPQYITDDSGKKISVVVPIGIFEELLEDIEDLSMVEARRNEPTVTHEQVTADLKQNGLL